MDEEVSSTGHQGAILISIVFWFVTPAVSFPACIGHYTFEITKRKREVYNNQILILWKGTADVGSFPIVMVGMLLTIFVFLCLNRTLVLWIWDSNNGTGRSVETCTSTICQSPYASITSDKDMEVFVGNRPEKHALQSRAMCFATSSYLSDWSRKARRLSYTSMT